MFIYLYFAFMNLYMDKNKLLLYAIILLDFKHVQ